MIYVYIGTDRDAVRSAIAQKVAQRGVECIRITDAHAVEDVRAALEGGGLFGGVRTVILENIATHPEMLTLMLESLPRLKDAADTYYIYEEKPLAELRKKLEKYAEGVEKYDAPKKERDTSIFAIANALRKSDKKGLWVSYMRQIEKGDAPEAIHGVLFWAAKDMFLKSKGSEHERARALVAALAELPHRARRRGEDLEYALERFVLGGV